MSEQIREQVSAFLDGELPDSETELFLKRLTRDGELRESFGRYALIGEALRGASSDRVTKGFAAGVNLAIDGEPVQLVSHAKGGRATNWWRPLAGISVAAGVATVAIVALQQRAIISGVRSAAPATAQNVSAAQVAPVQNTPAAREALSYTVPASSPGTPAGIAHSRLVNYVFAHSQYSSGLGQRGVLADLLIEDEPAPAANERAAQPRNPEARVAP